MNNNVYVIKTLEAGIICEYMVEEYNLVMALDRLWKEFQVASSDVYEVKRVKPKVE